MNTLSIKLGRWSISNTLIIFASIFPLIALLAWQKSEFFNSPLEHRIAIIWLELTFITLHLLLPGKIRDISWKALVAIAIFAFSGFASTLNAENPYAAVARHSEILLHILFGIAIYQRTNEKLAHYAITIGIIAAFIYSFLHMSLLLAIVPRDYDWVVHFPMFSNIRHWGYLLILVLCIIYSQILAEQTNKYLYLLLFLTMFGIFWSGGRGSFIAAMMLVIGSKLVNDISWKTYLRTIVATTIAAILAYLLSVDNPSLGIARLFFLDRLDAISSLDINTLSTNRIAIYTSSLKEQLGKAPLLGMGADNFRYSFEQDNHGIATHSHSILIQSIYEYGILGSAVLIYMLCRFVRHVYSYSKSNKHSHIKIMLLFVFLSSSLVDGHFYHSFSLLCISLTAPLLLTKPINNRDNTINSKKFYLLVGFVPILLIVLLHSRTFLAFTTPLNKFNQIRTVETFPSIIMTNNWLSSKNSVLLEKAFEIGIQYSDTQCGHLTLARLKSIPVPERLPAKCHFQKNNLENLKL